MTPVAVVVAVVREPPGLKGLRKPVATVEQA
jgi:hypothetical protein